MGAQDELLRLHKKYSPRSPWVIHGFRGKPSSARPLLDKGLYLSFGEHFQGESLTLANHLGRAFLETDDQATLPIGSVYELASSVLGIEEEELTQSLWIRAQRLFSGHICWQ